VARFVERRIHHRVWPARLAALFLALSASRARGQAQAEPVQTEPATASDAAEDSKWSLSASVYGYFVPAETDYPQPTVSVDWRFLHFEARYNYEDMRTASLWTGYTLRVGDEVTFELTLMLGGAFGGSNGIAPGYLMTLSYWRLELYTEGEYLFDFAAKDDWFYYTWSQLSVSPLDQLRVGIVVQRTRAYETELELQRGFLIGFDYEMLALTFHVFNPDKKPALVCSLAASF
jgi:hypothetical protein